MRDILELAIETRALTGKGPSYQTRRKGRIPAIVYGGDAAPEPISVDEQTLLRHVEKGAFLTTLFLLVDGDKKVRVIPRALQRDPVSDRPVHIDFMRLAEGATVRLAIPVRFKGQEASPGLKLGGVLNIVRHSIELLCPAEHIPDVIECDLSGMGINDSLHISHVALPQGAKPTIRDRDFTICSVVAPSGMTEEKAAADAAAPAEGAAPAAAAAPAAGAKPAAAAKPAEKDKK